MFRHLSAILALGLTLSLTAVGETCTPGVTFGATGAVPVRFGAAAVARSVAVDAGGSILAAGVLQKAVTGGTQFLIAMARLRCNGQLDTGFDVDGRKLLPALPTGELAGSGYPTATDLAAAIPVKVYALPGGQILVGGGTYVYRLLASGKPDLTFGAGGRISVAPDRIADLLPDGQGGLTVLPEARLIPGAAMRLLKFNPAGIPDPGFGTGGVLTVPVPADDTWGSGTDTYRLDYVTPSTLAFDYRTKGVLVTAVATYSLPPPPNGVIVTATFIPKYIALTFPVSPAGDCDPTSIRKLATSYSAATVSMTLPDATFVLAGSMPPDGYAFAARDSGEFFHFCSFSRAFALQPDAKLLVAGATPHKTGPYIQSPEASAIAVNRFGVDGSHDASFNGTQPYVYGGTGESIVYGDLLAAGVQPDGKLAAAGSQPGSDGFHFIVARYLSDGTLDGLR